MAKQKAADQLNVGGGKVIEFREDEAPHERYRRLAGEVRKRYRGVAIKFHRGPQTRTMGDGLKSEVQALLQAEKDSFALVSRLFSADEVTIKKIGSAISGVKSVFESPRFTLPYPAAGVRLLNEENYADFEKEFQAAAAILSAAVLEFAADFPNIVQRESTRRGRGFQAEDYAFDPANTIRVERRYIELEPPSYLMQLDPKVYEEQSQIVEAAFQQAVETRERELAEQLYRAVAYLNSRLQHDADGKPKTFRDSTVANLLEAVDQIEEEFQRTGVGDGAVLEAVRSVKSIIPKGKAHDTAKDLREDQGFREKLTKQLEVLGERVLGATVLESRRKLLLDFGKSSA